MPETATELTRHQEDTLARVRAAAPGALDLHFCDAGPLIAHGLIREVASTGHALHHAAYVAA